MKIFQSLFCEGIFNNLRGYRRNGIDIDYHYPLLRLYLINTKKSPWAMIREGDVIM